MRELAQTATNTRSEANSAIRLKPPMYENWKFARWETPVSDIRLSAMASIVDDREQLSILVNIDSGQVLFAFSDFPAYRSIDELYRTELWQKLYRQNLGSTLTIPDSEWIKEFRDDREALDAYHPNAVHYMINTDNGCVEVISDEPPEISMVISEAESS